LALGGISQTGEASTRVLGIAGWHWDVPAHVKADLMVMSILQYFSMRMVSRVVLQQLELPQHYP